MAGTSVATRARTKKLADAAKRAPKKRDYAEDRLQSQIVNELRWLLKGSIVFSIPNGGYRKDREAAKLKWTGQLNGVPDLCVVTRGGRAYFIECKSPKGVLSDDQNEMLTWMAVNAVPYIVARSLADVRAAVAQWRLETKEAATIQQLPVSESQ